MSNAKLLFLAAAGVLLLMILAFAGAKAEPRPRTQREEGRDLACFLLATLCTNQDASPPREKRAGDGGVEDGGVRRPRREREREDPPSPVIRTHHLRAADGGARPSCL